MAPDTPPYDLAVVIGRFQPPQTAHLDLVRRALALAPRAAVVMDGAPAPRTPRAPWSGEEREAMLRAALGAEAGRVDVVPVQSWRYDAARWAAGVRSALALPPGARVVRVGFEEDAGLPGFPDWAWEPVAATRPRSAELRHRLLTGADPAGEPALPEPVRALLRDWGRTPAFAQAAEEWRYILDYRASWAAAPYDVNFVTTDAVVLRAGRVLLVERKHAPGRGLWALPGGFVDVHEPILDAALRELAEETQLEVPEAELRGALKAQRVFDDPDRSLRGRTITHAFLFDLGEGPLPRVTASDDAARAFWHPLSEVASQPERFFDDHRDILGSFVAL